MLKNILLTSLLFFGSMYQANAVLCPGKLPNPVTDICWKCMFPMFIGPAPILNGEVPEGLVPPLVCACPIPVPPFVRVGVGISFWEPARMVEVVRTPMCSPSLGGIQLGNFSLNAQNGTNSKGGSGAEDTFAFYHVHWFTYPLLSWVGAAVIQGACLTTETLDLKAMSELDPTWANDELTFFLNPEVILFANPVSIAACAADAVSAAFTNFGLDPLFWCSGSAGPVFPLTGQVASNYSAVETSTLEIHRCAYKLHRSGLAMDTSTYAALCLPVPQPIMRKRQYKHSMVYPIPNPFFGVGLGSTSATWGIGKEFPYKGEDFAYTVWRKRMCCAF